LRHNVPAEKVALYVSMISPIHLIIMLRIEGGNTACNQLGAPNDISVDTGGEK
jgi:hypothetical protein